MKINKFLTVILALSLLLSSAGIYIAGADTVTSYLVNDDFSGELSANYQINMVDGKSGVYAEDGVLKIDKKGYFFYGVKASNLADKPVVVLEFKINPYSAAGSAGNIQGVNNKCINTICFYQGKIRTNTFNTGDVIGTYTADTWYHVMLAYSPVAATRDIWINGEYKGNYAIDDACEYKYNEKGFFQFGMSAGNNAVAYMDDIRVYALPSSLSYGSAVATEKGVSINFNMVPDKDTLKAANFIVKDENGNAVTVKSVSYDAENARNVNVEFDYSPNSNYTISVSGVTAGAAENDVVGNALALSESPEFSFVTSEIEIPANTYFWNDDFSGESIDTSYISAYNATTLINDGTTVDSRYSLTEEDTLKFGAYAKGTYFVKDVTSVANKPKLVISYSVKPLSAEDVNGSRKDYGISTVYLRNGIIYDNENGNNIGTYESGKWLDITCAYDNVSNTRDIYVNGEYLATAECKTLAAWQYSNSGRAYFCFYHYGYARVGTEFDNLEVYALPVGLRYDIADASVESLSLKFNITPEADTVIPSNFTVLDKDGNEVAVSSAELVAGAQGLVKLTFENELKPFSDYTVTAKNIITGSEENDVIGTALKLGNNAPVKFSTAGAAAIEYVNDGTVFYNDYSASVASAESELGQIATAAEFKTASLAGATGVVTTDFISDTNYSNGIYEVSKEDGNKYISMTQSSTAVPYWRTFVKAANIAAYDTVAFEYRVRPHLEVEGVRPIFESRNGDYYGIPMPILFDGKITFGGYEADKTIGKYHDGEWITLTTVYHRGYVTVEGDENSYVKTEIYADGEKIFDGFAKVESNTDLNCFTEGSTKNAMVTLRVRDYYGKANTGATVDMDYMKIYAPGETFNGKLTESENVSTEKIGMVFNSIPSYDEIASKVTVIDEAGVKVSDVVYADFLGEENIGTGYDSKAELVFATELEDNKNYILKVDGLTDVSGNEMTQYYPFTTGIGDIFSDGFTIETREADGKTYAKVSAKVLNKSLPETALTVTIASYTLSGEIETMVNIAEKNVTLTVSEDGQSFVSEEIEVTGADFVRGFLNKGTKAFIPAGEFPITAQ